jgi:hypothetical protein
MATELRDYAEDSKILDRREANGITLKNCPAYIREWIKRQRGAS